MNSRSLHFATPDFLWNLVALVDFMRPSLRKGAHVVLSSAAWQEIRVRSVGMTLLFEVVFLYHSADDDAGHCQIQDFFCNDKVWCLLASLAV
jgi:hypothetical protein